MQLEGANAMQRFFRLSLLSVFLSFSAATASAQLEALKRTTPEQRAAAQTDFLQKELGLEASQTEAVAAISLATAREAEPILKGSGSRFSIGRELRRISGERDQKLKTILSAEQWKHYASMKDEMKESVLTRLEKEAGSGTD
jgi:hypothetical protein